MQWNALGQGLYKINFDAAVDLERRCCGVGVVIRDSRGEFYAGLCKLCKYIMSVDMVKFNASFIGLGFALEVGFRGVMLEGDSLTVITSLWNGQIELVKAGVIVADTLDLSNLCSSCSFYLL